MVFISRLKLRNFKSFKAADIQLPETFICFAGPNGSGKCVDGDTEIFLADGGTKQIRDLMDEAMTNGNIKKLDDGYIAQCPNSPHVLSLNTKSMKIERRRIDAFVKRKAPERMLKVKTRSGKEIVATEYHPFFILENDKIVPIRADQLKEKVRVAIPRELPVEITNTLFLGLFDMISPEDNIYVAYNEKTASIIQANKGNMTWDEYEKRLGLPTRSLSCFVCSKQSILFPYLVRALRLCGLGDLGIADMICEVKSDGKGTIQMPWQNSDGFCRFLGYLLSDGSVSRSNNQIRFTNSSEKIIKDFVLIAKSLFNITPHVHRYKKSAYDVILNSVPLRNILLKFGMDYGGAGSKRIPDIILEHSTHENLAHLLSGLYSGDGYVSKNGVEITLKSERLIRGVELILLRLGIIPRTVIVSKRETKTGFIGTYFKTTVCGTENIQAFNKKIKMIHAMKRGRLETLPPKEPNPNVDLIEANLMVKRVVRDLGINIKQTRKGFPRLDAYCYNQCLPSRYGIRKLISKVFKPISIQKGIESKALMGLETLSSSDIFWDEIESIETIMPREGWVYDLTIAQNHNFIANGVFVHNSNLCDAIRFAMGEMSLKSLRAKKVKDLIHSGSKSAEVTINFHSENGGPSYEIKRAIRDDGKIRYRLNSKKTTRSAILEALKKHNLDESGRNIIAQGEVQRIIDMNGKERRGIIDSVAGIADFEDKKKEAMGELNLVKDRIREAQLVVGERRAFLDELGREKEAALKYLDARKMLQNAKGTLLKKEVDRLQKEFSESFTSEEKLLAAKALLDEGAAKIEGEITDVDSLRTKINADIQSKQKTHALVRKLEELKASCASKEQILEDKKGALIKAIDEQKEIAGAIKDELADADALSKEVAALRASLKEAEARLALAGGPTEDENAAGIRIRLEAEDKELSSMREKLASLTTELISKKELIEAKKAESQSILPKSENAQNDAKPEVSEEHLRRQIAKMASELEGSFSKVKEINARMAALDREMLELRERSTIHKVSSSPQFANPALRFISDLAKTKGSGIYGTMADLISFEPKYASAVEAAGGARLMYVIVDSMDTAAGVIDKLKKSREGRATFIPLDTIRASQPVKANGRTSVLEVIDFKEDVRKAVEYVFSETLLVDTIAEARKMGIGSNRMVTLEGEIFERSGVVSGGRSQSGILANNQARKIEAELSAAKAAKEGMLAELGFVREDESRMRSEKASMEIALKTIEMRRDMDKEKDVERENLLRRGSQLKQEIERLDEFLGAKAKEKENLHKLIFDKEKGIIDIKAQLKGAEEESRRIYEESNKARANLSATVSSLKATIEGKRSELDLRKAGIKATEERLEKLGREEKELVEKMGEVRKQIETEGEELKRLDENIRHASKEVEKLFDQMKALEEDIQALGKRRGEKRIETDKVVRELNLVGIKKATATTRLEDLSAEFSSYKEFETLDSGKEELNRMIKESEAALANIGNVNMTAIEMFDKKKAEIDEVEGRIGLLGREREAIMSMIDEIEEHKKDAFFEAFNSVSDNFTKLFTYINIGQGHLYLSDPANPFESGMFIKLRRSNQDHSLDALSGGEKTFVALMFVFALQLFKPAPFYILDEVDSALDKPNSKNLAELVSKLGAGSQFILVTHNDIVMSNSDTVIGVARADGVSRLVGIKLTQVAAA